VSLNNTSLSAKATGATEVPPKGSKRLGSIDALRGLVMLIMLVDHTRETFFLHMQVGDPVDVTSTSTGLVLLRLMSSFCAPVFIALTGLSAWLYSQNHTLRQTSSYLFKRGIILIFLEIFIVGTAWTGVFPPQKIYLQVIWAIGLCMISHNLLDHILLTPHSPFYEIWAILHQRAIIELPFGIVARTSYPVLPWIGVILLGFAIGPWFCNHTPSIIRRKKLVSTALILTTGFIIIRFLNFYGDHPWQVHEESLTTILGFVTLTKYPPSLLYLMPTIAFGAIFLYALEKKQNTKLEYLLSNFGAAPMFFYITHLYLLKALYLIAVAIYGENQGKYYGFDNLYNIILCSILLIPPLYYITCRFAALKKSRQDITWLKYF